MKRRLKKIGKILGVLVLVGISLFALWTAWENWTGAREWKDTREMLLSEGIELDSKNLLPDMPAEDENFARTPLIAAVTDFETGQPNDQIIYDNAELAERFEEIRLPELGNLNPSPSWKTGTPAKLDEIRRIIAEETGGDGDILAWMEQFRKEFAEIDAAAHLPENQLPVDVGDNFMDLVTLQLPHLQDIHEFQKLQIVRACAALQAGDNDQARAALQTSFQLQRTSMSHPSLIGFVIGVAMQNRSLSVIWEGLEAELWSEEDLRWIQEQLGSMEVLPGLERALVFEMVIFQFSAGTFMKSLRVEDAQQLVRTIGTIGGGNSAATPLGLVALIIPNGVWDHNLAYGARAMFEESILPVRERRMPDPKLSRLNGDRRTLRNFLARITFPAYGSVINRSFETAIATDQAAVACAVELHRIERGVYPPTLDVLVPDFLDQLPEDIFNPGSPMKYEKGAQGDRYRIYSVGKNGDDDGGKVAFVPEGNRSRRDLDKGDWAWGYSFPERDK